jgi:Flp pilus assembly pilin Flp
MARFIERFWSDEQGNTTIDWMVLTAGLVLLGAAVLASVGTSSQTLADDTAAVISDYDPRI